MRLSPRHFRTVAGGCGALVVALTVLLVALDARMSERTGLQRAVYPEVGFGGMPRIDVGRSVSLDFLLEDPALPRQFFSIRWNGFWHLPAGGVVELIGAGDDRHDRLDVWLDGEQVIQHRPPAGTRTQSRTLRLEAGVHHLRVDYEQHGGARALSLLWAPQGEHPRPLPSRHLFQTWPDRDAIRLANHATWLKRIVSIGWSMSVALGVAFLARHPRFRRLLRKLTRAAGGRPHGHRADEITASQPEPLGARGLLVVNAAFLGLSALFSSKAFLLTDLDSHAILGGDPALMNWQLQWVSRALYTDPLNLFNGNTFHPHPNVVALTDHMLSLAVINAPLSMLSDSPWFGYNLLIFLAYYLSCVGGYWFMREVTGSYQAGFWAGIFWAFLFFRIHHIGHLQVLSFQWMPFVAAALIRFLRSPTRARTLTLSVCFVAQALVSWYHAVITTILVLVLSVLQIGRQRLTLRHAAGAAAAVALCAAVVLPAAIPYRRSLDETNLDNRYLEALVPGDRVSLSSYLEPPLATLVGQMRQAGPWIWGEQTLYVGYTALALALAGLLIRRPHLTPDGHAPPRIVDTRWVATGICLVIAGFVLAKGFVSSQQVRLPLLHLSEVPGLDFLKGLRATQRFSLLLYFGIMILSGAGATVLAARCRSARSAWVATSLACLVFLAEVYPVRLPFEPRPYEISRLDMAIPKLWREETRTPVVLHLPIHYFLRAYATPEAVYMLDSTHHWARVVNGFSGAEPRGFRRTMEALDALPERRGVAALAELGVDLVAIHRSAPAAKRRSLAAFFEEASWATVHGVGDEHLVRIDPASIPAATGRADPQGGVTAGTGNTVALGSRDSPTRPDPDGT